MSDILFPVGDLNIQYQTVQKDFFDSGLAATVGCQAFTVHTMIKNHCDFNTGRAFPGIRLIAKNTGLATSTVQKAIATLKKYHLLRVKRYGKKNIYVPM